MDAILSQEKLRRIYEEAACSVTKKLMGITLRPGKPLPDRNACTVYTSFARGAHSGFAFRAEKSLTERMTRNMMRMEQVQEQDIEDYLREYLNVLCGQIVAAVFKEAKVGTRFGIPEFYNGSYYPENMEKSWEVSFLSDQNEGAWLIHYKALNVK